MVLDALEVNLVKQKLETILFSDDLERFLGIKNTNWVFEVGVEVNVCLLLLLIVHVHESQVDLKYKPLFFWESRFFLILIVDFRSNLGQQRIVNNAFKNARRPKNADKLVNEENHLHASMKHPLDHDPLVVVPELDDHAQSHAEQCWQDSLTLLEQLRPVIYACPDNKL